MKRILITLLALGLSSNAHAAFEPSLSETEGAKCQIEAPIARNAVIADRMLDVLIRNFRRAPPMRETGILGLSLGADDSGGRFEAVFRSDCLTSKLFLRERLEQMSRETSDASLAQEFSRLSANLLEVQANSGGVWEKPAFLAEIAHKQGEH